MTPVCRKYFLEAIQLSEKLIQLGNDAQCDCDDDRCLVLFGIILDSASKIRLEANIRLKILESEMAEHGIVLRSSGFNVPG